MSNIVIKPFREIDIYDEFFNSLKQDYSEFEEWFNRKANDGEKALLLEGREGIQAFLYLKKETTEITDVEPILAPKIRLKIGTFKINPHGTRLGERFIKKAFDYAIDQQIEELYVTIFSRHEALYEIFTKYGFVKVAVKRTANGEEDVLLKTFSALHNDIHKDYPRFKINENKKYGLGIYPEWHSQLFPDSLLHNESFQIIKDVSHTNSIHKVYICFMTGVEILKKGDLLLIYRTSDGKGPAHYRSVVTSVCTIEEVKNKGDFTDQEEFLRYCNKYSVFDESNLIQWFRKNNIFVIKMLYSAAFTRKVTKKSLMDIGINPSYWGFYDINDEEFLNAIRLGQVNEDYIIY